jgi:hypothetical protein
MIDMSKVLREAHTQLAGILGEGIEPVEVFARAEEHRSYWKPERLRVVLLAESHVFTHRAELQRTLLPFPGLPADTPRGFVRLVYSLGYGENDQLDRPILTPRNSGTPQYWKILQSCMRSVGLATNYGALQVSRTPVSLERLRNKITVLRQLRERGIWLVDASIAALYIPGHRKPAARLREAVLHASWDSYTRLVVEEATPSAVLCIGVGVARALRTRLDQIGVPWGTVHQPQAHLSSEEHSRILATYSAVCDDPRHITLVPSLC